MLHRGKKSQAHGAPRKQRFFPAWSQLQEAAHQTTHPIIPDGLWRARRPQATMPDRSSGPLDSLQDPMAPPGRGQKDPRSTLSPPNATKPRCPKTPHLLAFSAPTVGAAPFGLVDNLNHWKKREQRYSALLGSLRYLPMGSKSDRNDRKLEMHNMDYLA